MKTLKLVKFISFFSLILQVTSLHSQKEIAPSPLGPGIGSILRELGIYFGIGPSWQSGEFFASCDCPNFVDGSKLNFALGLIYKQNLDEMFAFGGKVSFWYLSNQSSYQQKETVLLKDQTNQVYPTPILFRQQLKMRIFYFSFAPFLEYRPFPYLFLRFGGRFAFPFSSDIEHTKILLQKTAQLGNGFVIDLSFVNGLQNVSLESGILESLTSPFVSLQPAVGFDFYLTGNFFGSIGYLHGIPLNTTAARGNKFKMNYWQITIEIRYAITMRRFLD